MRFFVAAPSCAVCSRFRQTECSLALQVSFAELAAVFVVEELRSPALRKWVEAQQAESTAVDDTTMELGEEDAALQPQSGIQTESKRREDRYAEVQSKYDSWRS